ncbi:MAG: hypothetical protein MN733_12235 [Nitrososphaera sp.]|nr:hypothetical protein [Nitrososphaera sp.]
MKINGTEVKGPAEEVLVLPRPTAIDLVFRAVAVSNMLEFESRCPDPKPKARLVAGGWKDWVDDPTYLEAIQKHGQLRFAWILLKSLEPSNIEWDTVDPKQPSTWLNWETDLKSAGLSQTEVNHVINCVASANSLNEQKLEAARQNFLHGVRMASEKSSYQNSEQPSTLSGEAASDSASDPQE